MIGAAVDDLNDERQRAANARTKQPVCLHSQILIIVISQKYMPATIGAKALQAVIGEQLGPVLNAETLSVAGMFNIPFELHSCVFRTNQRTTAA